MAEEKFRMLQDGPYATALFNANGQVLAHYEPMSHYSFLPRNGFTMLSPMSFTNLDATMAAMHGLVPLQ